MTEHEIIKQLQDNKVAWKFLSEEEKGCILKANNAGKVDNLTYDGEWENIGKPWCGECFKNNTEIWRISPDYQPEPPFTCSECGKKVWSIFSCVCGQCAVKDVQPEPKYVDLEIVKYDRWLGVTRQTITDELLPYSFTHLHCLPSLPNFDGFYSKDAEHRINITHVANYIGEGRKVYARLRK